MKQAADFLINLKISLDRLRKEKYIDFGCEKFHKVWSKMKGSKPVVIEREDFDNLFQILSRKGYHISGPTVRDNAIVYDDISSSDDLPVGYTDEQKAGSYKLVKSKGNSLFGYVVGPYSWKNILYPAKKMILSAKRDAANFEFNIDPENPLKHAFIGVRACEISALSILDKVLMEGEYIDIDYRRLRENLFVVAVNCIRPGGTCFCTSMQTGPQVTFGFDLALTEVIKSSEHFFVVSTGSPAGEEILKDLKCRPAKDNEIQDADKAIEDAVSSIGRNLDLSGIKELLYKSFDLPYWQEIAQRCLTCGNCTMVCPTCFCSNVIDTTDLSGQEAHRWRMRDSCFSVNFSYIHGGSIRASETSRYRQWLTHKLAYWQDQFGTSGCVGCGRCITWCPVGIDITEDVQAIRERI